MRTRNSTGAFAAVLQLLADGVVDAAKMITHRFPLDAAPEALHFLDSGGPAVKIVVGQPADSA